MGKLEKTQVRKGVREEEEGWVRLVSKWIEVSNAKKNIRIENTWRWRKYKVVIYFC